MSTPSQTGGGSCAGGGSVQATSSPSSDNTSSSTFGASTNSRVSGLLFSYGSSSHQYVIGSSLKPAASTSPIVGLR